ncbi:hypothetical protein Tco_0338173, partial [Tanacetum coccineum]
KATKQPTISKTTAKKPKPAPAKPKEKKRKPVSESSEAPPPAKRSKVGKVIKQRSLKSSQQLVDEFVDEGVPAAKPRLEDEEEAILQKVLEESLKDAYPTQRGPLPPDDPWYASLRHLLIIGSPESPAGLRFGVDGSV